MRTREMTHACNEHGKMKINLFLNKKLIALHKGGQKCLTIRNDS